MIIAEQLKRNLPASEATNAMAMATNAAPPPKRVIDDYKRKVDHLSNLRSRVDALLVSKTEDDPVVKGAQQDVDAAQKIVDKMEDDYPALTSLGNDSKSPMADPRAAYQAALDNIEVLQSTVSNQSVELEKVRAEGTNLVQLDSTIRTLEAQSTSDNAELAKIESQLHARTIQTALAGRISGIDLIESPTPPTRDLQKAPKVIAGLGVGGIVLGLGLAFLLEMVLDRSFKRPQEVTNRLKLPFFLAIPYLNGKMKLRLPPGGAKMKLLTPAGENSDANSETTPDGKSNALRTRQPENSFHRGTKTRAPSLP